MTLPRNADLKAKVTNIKSSHSQRLANLKGTLKLAYESVRRANRKSRDNKKYYDRRAKHRQFQAGDYVDLNNPARQPGLSRKFHKYWAGPYEKAAKISDLNYEIKGRLSLRGYTDVDI